MDNFPVAMADGIREKWITGINAISSVSAIGLAETLLTKAYMLEEAIPSTSLLFKIPNQDLDLPQSFAFEAARFSSATFESLLDARPSSTNEESLGWPLIRTYYAAFFAAHALLRICGESVTFLTTNQTNKLNQVAQIYTNQSSSFSNGIFHFKITDSSQKIQLTQLSRGGGSHEDFWKIFYKFLIEVENVLAQKFSSSPDAITAIKTSQALRKSLSRENCSQGSWLSQSRNSINYRHEYGIWFPYKINRQKASSIARGFDNWQLEDSDWEAKISSADLAEAHQSNSHAIAALLTCSLKDLAKRNTCQGKSFVDKLPFALLRQRRPGW